MKKELFLYHGSNVIVEKPKLEKSKSHKDFGLGFYCVKDNDLAKEWGVSLNHNGIVNKYLFKSSGLKILNLVDKDILSWIAVLIDNRDLQISSDIGKKAIDYVNKNYAIDISLYDVIIGYRADNSNMIFVRQFLNNIISLDQLKDILVKNNKQPQIVLQTTKALEKLTYMDSYFVDKDYYGIKNVRDIKSIKEANNLIKNSFLDSNDYILDIMRGDNESL